MLDTKDLRGLPVAELKAKVEELKQTHSKEYVKTKVGQKTEKAVNLRNIRKDIARLLTIITEKENKTLGNSSLEKKKQETKEAKHKEKKEVQKSSFVKIKKPTKVKKEKVVEKKKSKK